MEFIKINLTISFTLAVDWLWVCQPGVDLPWQWIGFVCACVWFASQGLRLKKRKETAF
jgi:hypothetical protein